METSLCLVEEIMKRKIFYSGTLEKMASCRKNKQSRGDTDGVCNNGGIKLIK